MPTSSRVTTSSRVMGAATGDKSASSNSNGNCVDNKHGDIPQQEDTRELSTTTAIATFTTAVSSATNDSIASLKVKEEHTDSISDTIGNGNRGDDHDLSAFSSLHSERDSSKVAPTSSTPSRNTATPRSDFLSPPPSSVNVSSSRKTTSYDNVTEFFDPFYVSVWVDCKSNCRYCLFASPYQRAILNLSAFEGIGGMKALRAVFWL